MHAVAGMGSRVRVAGLGFCLVCGACYVCGSAIASSCGARCAAVHAVRQAWHQCCTGCGQSCPLQRAAAGGVTCVPELKILWLCLAASGLLLFMCCCSPLPRTDVLLGAVACTNIRHTGHIQGMCQARTHVCCVVVVVVVVVVWRVNLALAEGIWDCMVCGWLCIHRHKLVA